MLPSSTVGDRVSFPKAKSVVVAGCLAALLFAAAPASAAPILSINPTTTSATEGTFFTVDFDISGVLDLFSYQFSIAFDSNVLTALSVTQGSFLSGSLGLLPTIDNNTGQILVFDTLFGGSGVSGGGTLFSVTFGALLLPPGVTNASSLISMVFDPIFQGDGFFDSSLNFITPSTGPFTAATASVRVSQVSVPESSTLLILAMGLTTTAAAARWRQRLRAPSVART